MKKTSNKQPLTFDVAPHIVHDLGLNLYTSLPRVLVEFLANAYDADSPVADIFMDADRVVRERKLLKAQWEVKNLEKSGNRTSTDPADAKLETQTLPLDVQIMVTDKGYGMSRDDLQKKFLVAGRRKREEEGTVRSPEGRILMGRKGLGKLAGFGIARNVVLITRKKNESHATKITLDYDEIVKKNRTNEVVIQEELLRNGGGIEPHGTRIILSKLVYGPMKSGESTIAHAIGDHFSFIERKDFRITYNGIAITPTPRELAYAYPVSDALRMNDLVEHSYTTEEGAVVSFAYRIRFTAPGKHLNARERGVRIYAHSRLAAAPDLLDLKTGIHGFNNTHYLDGIVYADFIDDDSAVDYIATDRQSLRWDSSLLAPMRDFLTKQMEEAIKAYQKTREEKAKVDVRKDTFTRESVEKTNLPKHRRKLAYNVASMLCTATDDGVNSQEYKEQLPIFLEGLAQGDILKTLAELASKDHPDFNRVVAKVTELTARELSDFIRFVEGRLNGIEALKKLYRDVDFKKAKNEKTLHSLFKKNAWLIDPTFKQFLTSDAPETDVNERLSKHLHIGKFSPEGYDPEQKDEIEEMGTNKRPDLVFLLSSKNLRRVVIIELKAPNTPLHIDHLNQLKGYMQRAEAWLGNQRGEKRQYKVEGFLIGSHAAPESKSDKVTLLQYEIDNASDSALWKVFDIGEILERTERVHQELLDIYEQIKQADESDDDLWALAQS